VKHLMVVLTFAGLAACASEGTDAPIGPAQFVDLQLQPVRVAPNPQGAFALGEVTGCRVQFIGPAAGADTWRFSIQPTRRVPTIAGCLASLKSQPGVVAVSAVAN